MENTLMKAVNQLAMLGTVAVMSLNATVQMRLLAAEREAGRSEGVRGSLGDTLNDNRRILASYAACGMFTNE